MSSLQLAAAFDHRDVALLADATELQMALNTMHDCFGSN
jgi:hypothetical protein